MLLLLTNPLQTRPGIAATPARRVGLLVSSDALTCSPSFSTDYACLSDLEILSSKLWELDPEAERKASLDLFGRPVPRVMDEDEQLLQELLDDTDDESTSAPQVTRSRQPRRPGRYGSTGTIASSSTRAAEASPTAELRRGEGERRRGRRA